eukprot:2305726-Pyramimonas_sp.AAC.1
MRERLRFSLKTQSKGRVGGDQPRRVALEAQNPKPSTCTTEGLSRQTPLVALRRMRDSRITDDDRETHARREVTRTHLARRESVPRPIGTLIGTPSVEQ